MGSRYGPESAKEGLLAGSGGAIGLSERRAGRPTPHDGEHQAVCSRAIEHLPHWERVLKGKSFPFGMLGDELAGGPIKTPRSATC